MAQDEETPPRARSPLAELALLFLRLGVVSFGGPAAHIAMMEEEVVRRRSWISHADFLDLVGATNLIPGPSSTELAIHIGHRRAGFPGLVVAGACFILPAGLITFAIAVAYQRLGKLPAATGLLYGVKPVIIAVVAQALLKLGKTALKTRGLGVLGAIAAACAFARLDELAILFGAGAISLVGARRAPGGDASHAGWLATGTAGGTGALAPLFAAMSGPPSATGLFLVFAKIGSVLFGSGYVLLAFLRAELVVARHWLTDAQLVDAVAVGQLTPGPVFTTATFVGYVVGGRGGAIAATLGIFLPAFVFVAASGWLVPRIRHSPRAGAFLDGVNVASLALMAVVTFDLARASLVDVPAVLIGLVSAVLLFRTKVSSTWLVLGGAALGVLLSSVR